MRKKILLITLIAAIILTGCKKKGEIEESHPEFYYLRTDYYSQHFVVLNEYSDDEMHTAVIATDPELSSRNMLSAEPNTYVVVSLPKSEYQDIIGDTEIFEATLSLVTVINPKTQNMYTYIIGIDEPVTTALQKATHDNNPVCKLYKKEMQDYLSTYRFIYYKM